MVDAIEARMGRQGRRARRADAPRRHRVNLSLNDVERQAVEEAAATEGLSVGAFAAQAAVAVARGQITPIPTDDRERLAELVHARVALSRIGTNLNQLARAANSGASVPAAQLDVVLDRVQRAVARLDDASVRMMPGA